jgi:hypothetical protein
MTKDAIEIKIANLQHKQWDAFDHIREIAAGAIEYGGNSLGTHGAKSIAAELRNHAKYTREIKSLIAAWKKAVQW